MTTSRSDTVLRLSQCKLQVVKGPGRGKEQLVAGDVIRLGKAEDNDIVLSDDTVSRLHAEILRDPKGYLLRDLRSTNGTFLNGAEIREAYIRAGSLITIGTVQLKFQPVEERIAIRPSPKECLGGLVGRSVAMRELFSIAEQVAPTGANLLIEGEAGVGKQSLARAIHALSPRQAGPFRRVDCREYGAAFESELFGHDKGALGASGQARQGAFELAQGGTIYLDHIDELAIDMQPKLLRLLEQRELRRIGGTRPLRIDVRVVAGSERDLEREVEKSKFHAELHFRLAKLVLRVPPLRDRREDIPLLIEALRGGEGASTNDTELQALKEHGWPGNVRELGEVVARGQGLGPAAGEPTAMVFDPALPYRAQKERWESDFETRYLRWLLESAGGNISRAARSADMDRKYLHKLLRKHRIS